MAKRKLKKFDTGGTGNKKNAEVPINAANPTWLKEVTIRPEPEDTYANYYLKNNPNPGLARAMFLSPLEMIAGYPQAAMMKALTAKYGEPSNKIGYEKPEGFLQHAWNFGVNSFFDPSNLVGVGLVDDIAKLGLKGAVKKSFYNTVKDVPAELPGSPNTLVGSNVNPYENYFIKYKQKDKELQALAGSKKIDYNTYTKTLDNYKEELLKEIGLTKKLGSGSFGEVFELPNDASKVIKLGSPSGGGWTPELIESLKSIKQNANLAIPEQVQNFEIPSLWKTSKPSKKEALIMPNLNITTAERLDLNKRDRYALFLKQARQLRDKGINLDVENHENFKYNIDKNVFDIYDLNPGNSIINPGYYMTYIKNNTKRNLLDDMMYQNGGNLNNNNTMNDLAQQVQQMMQQGATKGQVAQQLIAAVQQGQVDQESVMQIFQQLGITEQDLAQEPTPQQQVMNYGGKMMFAEGGQPSPEEIAMMQQQGQPQQGGQDPMAQVMQLVQQMVQQGAKPMDVIVELLNQQVHPEAVAQVLVQMGMPQDQVVAAIQQVMQQGQQNGGEPQMENEEQEEETENETEEVEDDDALEEKTEIPDEGVHTMMKFGGQAKKLLKKAYGGKMSSKGKTTEVYRDPMDFVKDRQVNFSNAIKFNTFSNTAEKSIDQNLQSEFPSLKTGGKLNKFEGDEKSSAVTPETTKTNKVLYTDPKTGTVREVTQADLDALTAKKVTTNMVPIAGYNPMMQQYAQQFSSNPMFGNQYLNQVPVQGFQSPFTFPNVSVKNTNLPQNFGLVTGMAGKFENMDWRVSGAEPLYKQRGFIGKTLGLNPKTIGQRIYIDWGTNQPLTTPTLPTQGKEVPPMAGQKQYETPAKFPEPSYTEEQTIYTKPPAPLTNPEFEGIGALPGTEVNLSTNTNNYQLKSRPDYLGSSKVSQVSSVTPINKIDNTYATQQPETLSNVPEYKKPGFFEQRRLDKIDKLNNDIKFNPNTYTQNPEFKSSNTSISTNEAVNMVNNPPLEGFENAYTAPGPRVEQYGGPTNYDIQNALNVLKMAYGGYIPKADSGMGLNKNMDTSLYNEPNSSTYQDILNEKNKNKSNGFGNFVDANWNPNNLAGQWATSLETGKGYADTIRNTMDATTQFLNNMSMNDTAKNLANQSSSNAPLSYNTDQGLYDQFGNQTFGTQGNQVLNPTNTGFNLNQPAIFKSGGESFVLNGKKYEMGGEIELSDEELKALKKLGYIVTKK